MKKRHPICNYTRAAVRRQRPRFHTEADAILRDGVTRKSLNRLAVEAADIFTDIDPEDMDEVAERRATAANFTDHIRQ